jgi:hypothetical protein
MGRGQSTANPFEAVLGERRGRSVASIQEAAVSWQTIQTKYAALWSRNRHASLEEKKEAEDALYETLKDLRASLERFEGRGFEISDIEFSQVNNTFFNRRAASFFGAYLGIVSEGSRRETEPLGPVRKTYEYLPLAPENAHIYTCGNLLLFDEEDNTYYKELLTRPIGENFGKREMAEVRKAVKPEILERIQRRLAEGPRAIQAKD